MVAGRDEAYKGRRQWECKRDGWSGSGSGKLMKEALGEREREKGER